MMNCINSNWRFKYMYTKILKLVLFQGNVPYTSTSQSCYDYDGGRLWIAYEYLKPERGNFINIWEECTVSYVYRYIKELAFGIEQVS